MKKIFFSVFTIIFCIIYFSNPAFTQPHSVKMPFITFFDKFSNDPSFQISCINFPIKIIQTDDDNTNTVKYIQKKDWKYTNLLKLKGTKNVVKIVNVNENLVDVKVTIVDTGVLVEHFFKYGNGKWMLEYVKDESD